MREISLTKGYVALVDDCDYERVSQFKWRAHVRRKTVYAVRGVGRTMQQLHRFILNLEPCDKCKVDHRDRNGLNNCRGNLRVCTHGENLRNQDKHSNNTTGWKGVSWYAQGRKFRAHINSNGKYIHIGYFHNPITAALEYDKAAIKHHGDFACVNFPAKQQAA
jgi:hypothetical protein